MHTVQLTTDEIEEYLELLHAEIDRNKDAIKDGDHEFFEGGIPALEAVIEGLTATCVKLMEALGQPESPQLFAIPFGLDGFCGDSMFYCDSFAVKGKNPGYVSLLETFIQTDVGQDLDDDNLNEVAGFWVVEQKSLEPINAPWPINGCGSDSETYRCNTASKRVAASLAVSTVYRDGVDDGIFDGW